MGVSQRDQHRARRLNAGRGRAPFKRGGRGSTPPPVWHVVHRWFLYGALDSHPFTLHRTMQCRSPPKGPPGRCLDPPISVAPSAAGCGGQDMRDPLTFTQPPRTGGVAPVAPPPPPPSGAELLEAPKKLLPKKLSGLNSLASKVPGKLLIGRRPGQNFEPSFNGRGGGPGVGGGGGAPPCVTFRLVVAPLRGPGQSPVLPFACCVGSLRSVGRCGRCSCWCRFRVRRAQ